MGCGSKIEVRTAALSLRRYLRSLGPAAGSYGYRRERCAQGQSCRVHLGLRRARGGRSSSSYARWAAWPACGIRRSRPTRTMAKSAIGKPAYRVSIAMPPEYNPFRLSRKADAYRGRVKYPPVRAIVDVVPAGDTRCSASRSILPTTSTSPTTSSSRTTRSRSSPSCLHRKEVEGPAPSLVIAPTSVTHTWENEIARFAPTLTHAAAAVGRRTRAALRRARELRRDHHVVRAGPPRCRTARALQLPHADSRRSAEREEPSSQIAKVVRNLRADHRLALTGTPVENSLRDLWSIFAFVEPGLARFRGLVPPALREPDRRGRRGGGAPAALAARAVRVAPHERRRRARTARTDRADHRVRSLAACSAGSIAASPKPRGATSSRNRRRERHRRRDRPRAGRAHALAPSLRASRD